MNRRRSISATRSPSRHVPGVAGFYGAVFLVVGVFLPFFPVFLAGRGLSESQIAIILAAPLALRVVFAPMTGAIADRLPDRRYALVAYAWISAATFLSFALFHSFMAMLVVASLFAIVWTAVLPVTDSIALTFVRSVGADYGRVRLWGSVTFIIANLGAGHYLQGRSGEAVFWLIFACLAVTALSSLMVPPSNGEQDDQSVAGHPAAGRLLTPRYMLVIGAASIILAGHAMLYSFGTLYWEGLDLPRLQIGALWAIGVVAEIALFAVSGLAVRRFGSVGLIAIGGAATVLRWLLFPWLDTIWIIGLSQVLHGLTFGASYLGAVHFISETLPERVSSRAQGWFATIGGAAMAGAMLISGPLYGQFGGMGFLAMAALGALGLVMLAIDRVRER